MRVGIIALQHESNTFLARPTTVEDFRRELLASGESVRRYYEGGHHEVSGFFEGLRREQLQAVPIFAAATTPSGTITADTYRRLLADLLEQLDLAGKLDGLLLAPHGAGVSEGEPDMDGHWLTEVRRRVGPKVPIVATIDPHANLSARMVFACDAIIPYRTNPHVDQRIRGLEAASLLARTLRGEVRPTQAAAFPPVAINIACQHTEAPPSRDLIALADEQLKRPGVLANGVVLGFPYADVPEMGSSFVVVTNDDPALAQRLADELADYLVKNRRQFVATLPDAEEAVEQAMKSEPPVCLLDLGDNVGGGSPGDGTVIAEVLLRKRLERSLVCLCDPEVAGRATAAGVGATIEVRVGGKIDQLHGQPLHVHAHVRRLHDGAFEEPNVRHGGKSHYAMGQTAVLDADGLTLLVHSVRTPPFSLNQITSCGLDPAAFRFIIAKGVNAPLAAYGPVCRTFIRVDTPGVTTAAMQRLPFKHRRRPLFPFEELS